MTFLESSFFFFGGGGSWLGRWNFSSSFATFKVCLFYEVTLSVPRQGVPQVPT
jgi:hypothetical protein